MTRVPLTEPEDLPPEQRYFLESHDIGVINLMKAAGNNPLAMHAYLKFGMELWDASGLGPRERELFILATARSQRSRYEWHQHVHIANEAGVTPAEISAISRGEYDAFYEDEAALLQYATELANGEVTAETHESLEAAYGASAGPRIAFLGSRYVGTHRFAEALDIPLEEEFVGWEPQED
jgi:alkylhydroperoxidase family enzyme